MGSSMTRSTSAANSAEPRRPVASCYMPHPHCVQCQRHGAEALHYRGPPEIASHEAQECSECRTLVGEANSLVSAEYSEVRQYSDEEDETLDINYEGDIDEKEEGESGDESPTARQGEPADESPTARHNREMLIFGMTSDDEQYEPTIYEESDFPNLDQINVVVYQDMLNGNDLMGGADDHHMAQPSIRRTNRAQEEAANQLDHLRDHDRCDSDNFDKREASMADHQNSNSNACMDSGASGHWIPDTPEFRASVPGTEKPTSVVVYAAGVNNTMRGNLMADFVLMDPNYKTAILLERVVFVKNLRRPLISITLLTKEGYIVIFAGTRCVVLTPGDNDVCLLLDRRSKNNLSTLYEIPMECFANREVHTAALAATHPGPDLYITWHRRMGHLNDRKMRLVLPEEVLPKKACEKVCACHECMRAKVHKQVAAKKRSFNAPFAGHSTSVDYAGPFRVRSPFGHRYFCLFVDVKTSFITIKMAKLKSELDELIMAHIAKTERHMQPRKMVTIISDGALCSHFIKTELAKLGITMLIIAPGASKLNLVERSNRTVGEGARAMCDTAGTPPQLFLLACRTMVEAHNRIFRQNLLCAPDGRPLTPIELYEGRTRKSIKHLFQNIRVFGSLAFALTRSDKQVTKSERCINVGLAFDNPNASLLMSLETKRFLTSRDTVSDEGCLPLKKAFAISKELAPHHDQGESGESEMDSLTKLQAEPKSLDLYEIPEDEEEPNDDTSPEEAPETVDPDDAKHDEKTKASEATPQSDVCATPTLFQSSKEYPIHFFA